MINMVHVLEETFKLGIDDDHAVERKVTSAWKDSPDLRAEFGDLESAVAYYKAVASGKVKILRGTEIAT